MEKSKLETLLSTSITDDQRTEEWYKRRYGLLTASDCASSLESNPFQTKHQLYLKKIKPFTMADYTKNPIDAIEHGIKYEPIALNLYERFQATKVHEVGLYIHPKFTWLGASPDGITETGKLVEIKCVYRRYLHEKPPLYYWIQTQIQMEVTNLDECDLFQCKFIEYLSKQAYLADTKTSLKGHFNYKGKTHYWKLEQYKCTTIKRDKKWFRRSLPQMKSFWASVTTARKEVEPTTPTTKKSKDKAIKRKRDSSLIPAKSHPSKTRPRSVSTDNVYTDWNEWVSATNTRNWMLNDPVLDYLHLYGRSHGIKTDDEIDLSLDSGKFIKDQGLLFENAIYDNIIHRIGDKNIVKIGSFEEAHSKYKADVTFQAMKEGFPLIFQGVLHDHTTKTYGVADIICRSDYINKIFENNPLTPTQVKQKAPILSKTKMFHYCIIDIKYSTLRLYKDTETLCNDPQMKANKAQVCIYNQALGTTQGFTPPFAYILGKRVIESKTPVYNPFYLAGIVDFTDHDADIIRQTGEAISWYRRVKTEGASWTLYPPSTPELYPNMSNSFDRPWHSAKKELAHRTKDISVLWYCGPTQRNLLHKDGVYSWDDPKCTAAALGFKNIRAKQLQAILDANQTTKSSILPLPTRMPKDAIKFLTNNTKPNALEYYVDFETVSDCTMDFKKIRKYKPDHFTPMPPKYSNLIYMIGFGWYDPITHHWRHKSYMIEYLTAANEAKIVSKFITDMYDIKTKLGWKKDAYPRIYHWGHAEITTMLKAIERSPKLTKPLSKHVWMNLLDVFKSIPITIKGVFSFGLKDVVKGLYSANLIPTQWEDKAIDGRAAMFAVINADMRCKESSTPLTEDDEMIQITQYNETDCKVMFEILEFLRQRYIKSYKSNYYKKIKFVPYTN